MSEEVFDINQGGEVEGGFILHPAGYEGPVHCTELKFSEDPVTKQVTAIILKLDCDGANVQEFISLKTTERYTLEIIKSKLNKMLIAFGVRKVGERSPRLMDDIKKVQGGYAHARLKLDKFQSKQTGKWLEGNKVDYFLTNEEYEQRKKSGSVPSGADHVGSVSTTSPSQAPAVKKFNFG